MSSPFTDRLYPTVPGSVLMVSPRPVRLPLSFIVTIDIFYTFLSFIICTPNCTSAIISMTIIINASLKRNKDYDT